MHDKPGVPRKPFDQTVFDEEFAAGPEGDRFGGGKLPR